MPLWHDIRQFPQRFEPVEVPAEAAIPEPLLQIEMPPRGLPRVDHSAFFFVEDFVTPDPQLVPRVESKVPRRSISQQDPSFFFVEAVAETIPDLVDVGVQYQPEPAKPRTSIVTGKQVEGQE